MGATRRIALEEHFTTPELAKKYVARPTRYGQFANLHLSQSGIVRCRAGGLIERTFDQISTPCIIELVRQRQGVFKEPNHFASPLCRIDHYKSPQCNAVGL
jgi:hypothetical protein